MKSELLDIEIETLEILAPAGFFIAINLEFSGAMASYIRYEKSWVEFYTQNSFFLTDPFLQWTKVNVGICRWSDIHLPDPNNIAMAVMEYGLRYGASASMTLDGKRSIGTFARGDREFTDAELNLLSRSLKKLHIAHVPDDILTSLELKTLQLLTDGNTMKEVSVIFEVSSQLIIARMMTVRRKLGVKTNIEAGALATKLKLFDAMDR